MFSRRKFTAGVALLCGGLVVPPLSPARALDWTPFAWEPFEAAHAGAVPVVVAVLGNGCAVCGAQAALLDDLLAEHTFGQFLRFRVDFDAQKDVAERLNVHQPGAILAQVCYEEIGRIVGLTDANTLRKLLQKTQAA